MEPFYVANQKRFISTPPLTGGLTAKEITVLIKSRAAAILLQSNVTDFPWIV